AAQKDHARHREEVEQNPSVANAAPEVALPATLARWAPTATQRVERQHCILLRHRSPLHPCSGYPWSEYRTPLPGHAANFRHLDKFSARVWMPISSLRYPTPVGPGTGYRGQFAHDG